MTSGIDRGLWCSSLVLALVGVSACGPGSVGDDEVGGSDESDETDETDDGSDDGGVQQIELVTNKDVDILLVIDNSGSMGEEQANLAANFGAFIDVLEAVDVNYRIGVTTTDNGNPWCPAGSTTPEAGKLVLSSCKTRLGDFLFGDTVDVQDVACNDLCSLGPAELEIVPTTTDVDPNPTPRPWLERIEGKQNLPEGTDMAEAFKCFAPQGVNGCGFESQLESMYLALQRTVTLGESSYGFIRDNAVLAVVFLTDEADCSYNKDWSDIFSADGNKVFWSDPLASFPTSAVCWNAGVQCVGDPSNYDSCDPVDKDIDGDITDQPGAAVLHPLDRYVDLVEGLEASKQQLNPEQEIIVSLIAGVGSDGSVFYASAANTDPEFQDSFGIGPGCTGPGEVLAVPPVRLRTFTEAFTPNNMFSVCSSDYSDAFQAIASVVTEQIKPACYTSCVVDTNLSTPDTVDPACTVEQKRPGSSAEPVEECLRDANGYVIDPQTNDYTIPSADANVCFAMLVDVNDSTASVHDDMSPECAELGYNLEFRLVRRPGFPAPSGTSVSATCSLSGSPQIDCPGLGG